MWEIYAYQNAASLAGMFNAVAAIIGSSTYLSAIAAVAFVGFIAAAAAYAFAPQKLQGWYWLFTVLLVYSILFLPRATVQIVDKTGGSAPTVVANVPLGMAMLGGLTSTIGNTITELFETAFTFIPGIGGLDSNLTYQNNGLLFGNRLVAATRSIAIADPNLRTDVINFIGNCTMYDLADGTIAPTTFAASDNIWPLLSNTNPGRFTTINTGAGTQTVPCDTAYSILGVELPLEVNTQLTKLAFKMNPTLPAAAALGAIAAQIPAAYIRNQIAAGSATVSDLILQNALINAINDTGQIVGQKINDNAALTLGVGRAQAVAQQNAAWLNGAKIAEEALPIFRNVVEALMYGAFPLLILLLFLLSGQRAWNAFTGYVAVMVWIQLWPPLYAILNYMGSVYSAYDLAAAADIGTGVRNLSLLTAGSIYQTSISAAAVVGSMVAVIPFIAWAAVRRLESFGPAAIGGLSSLQATAAAASGAAAVGNVSQGNTTLDQRNVSPSTSNAWVSRTQDLGGNWSTRTGLGTEAIQMLRNEGFATHNVQVGVSEKQVQEANSAAEMAGREAVVSRIEEGSILTDAFNRGWLKSRSARASYGTSSQVASEVARDLQELNKIATDVSARTTMSQQQAVKAMLGLGLMMGAGGQIDKTYLAAMSLQDQKVVDAMTAEQRSVVKRFAERATTDEGYLRALVTEDREGNEISARLATTKARADLQEKTFIEKETIAQRLARERATSENYSIDLFKDPHLSAEAYRLQAEYGHNSAGARIMFNNELARNGLPFNTTTYWDGRAAAQSPDDLRGRYDDSKPMPRTAAPMTEQTIRDDYARNRTQVDETNRPYADPSSTVAPRPGVQEAQDAVAKESDQIDREVVAQQAPFDMRYPVRKGPSGEMTTPYPLTKTVVDSVSEDAKSAGNNAFDGGQNLWRKLFGGKEQTPNASPTEKK